MTKKELTMIIAASVKGAIRMTLREEFIPIIRKAIKQEFYRLAQEVESNSKQKKQSTTTNFDENMSLVGLMNENQEEDINRKIINKKIFNNNGRFSDILNETANNHRSIPKDAVSSNQIEIDASKLGYDKEFDKVGSSLITPGIEPGIESPMKIQVPTTNPDGKPINYEKVPPALIKNMMKNYSGFLEKVEKKRSSRR